MTSLAEKLQHLRELGEKATPGPWRATPHEAECSEIIIPAPFPADYAEEYQHCGPHRIVKLQEVRSR